MVLFVLSSGLPLVDSLDDLVLYYRQNSYAAATKKSYQSHLNSYLHFCEALDISPVPVTSANVCRYAAYLAGIKQLKASSVPKYLNIIRILHQEYGFPNPLQENWFLHHVLRGIKSILGQPVRQSQPITPSILLQIKAALDLSAPLHITFWAACLSMFYGLLRKSNVLGQETFDPSKHLCREDILAYPWGLGLRIKWSKTMQYHERTLIVPLPLSVDHPLCPSSAILHAFQTSSAAPLQGPAFTYCVGDQIVPLTYHKFLKVLKETLTRANINCSCMAAHSFRRGGASWALSVGVPGEMIQILGDWRSNAYQQYLNLPLSVKANYAHHLLSSISY